MLEELAAAQANKLKNFMKKDKSMWKYLALSNQLTINLSLAVPIKKSFLNNSSI